MLSSLAGDFSYALPICIHSLCNQTLILEPSLAKQMESISVIGGLLLAAAINWRMDWLWERGPILDVNVKSVASPGTISHIAEPELRKRKLGSLSDGESDDDSETEKEDAVAELQDLLSMHGYAHVGKPTPQTYTCNIPRMHRREDIWNHTPVSLSKAKGEIMSSMTLWPLNFSHRAPSYPDNHTCPTKVDSGINAEGNRSLLHCPRR